MYYKCKLYPSPAVVFIQEEDLDVIVHYLSSSEQTLLILGYLSLEEIQAETNESFVELKCNR